MHQKEVLVVYFGLIIKVIAFMWHSGLQDKKVIEVKKLKLNSLFWFNKIQVKTYLLEKKNNKDEKKNLIIIKSWKKITLNFQILLFFL